MNETMLRHLQAGVDAGAFTGAQACAIRDAEILLEIHAGHTCPVGFPVDAHTRFDVASLTKVMATTTAVYVLTSGGVLDLDDPVHRYLDGWKGGDKERVTLRHLLAHTSGLPAWRPLFSSIVEDPELGALYPGAAHPEPAQLPSELRTSAERAMRVAARRRIVQAAIDTPLERKPGASCVYSDIGFLLLGEIVASCAGMPFDRFCHDWIFRPLGLEATGFRPLPSSEPGIFAATGQTRPRPPAAGQEGSYRIPPQRGHDDPGEVDDDNCWAMGGVSGHAGLFSTSRDVARWGDAIRAERQGAGVLGRADVLERLLALDDHPLGPPRALGFDLPSGPSSSAGSLLGQAGPAGARGHLAFTGCSVWIDLDRGLTVALLTNRVYPDRSNEEGIRRFRPSFHDAIVQAADERDGEEPPAQE